MVTSMSTISSISLLNTLAVTDFAALQEKTVQLGHTEVIDHQLILIIIIAGSFLEV